MTETQNPDSGQQIERIHTFDLLRGTAIIGVIFIHRVLWDYWFQFYTGGYPPPEIAIMFLFITMAGIFYVISGAVNSFMIQKRLDAGQFKPKQVILGGWVTGVVLVVYSHLFRIFLLRFIDDGMPLVASDPSLENITGFLPYFLLYGRLPDPLVNPSQFLALETLAMIGWTIIFMSTILGLYYRRRGSDDSNLIYYVLLTLGSAILVVAPFLRTAIGEWSNNLALSGNYLFAYFTEPLTNGMMPLFPYLAYGCFGGLVGVAVARREKQRYVLGAIAAVTVIMLILGLLFTADIEALPGAEPFTWDSHVNLFGRRALQLGFFFLLFLVGLALLDFRSEDTRTKWSGRLGVVSTFGKLALTVYMLEGVMAVALGLVVAPLWPSWNVDLPNIALFGLLNAVIWYGILRVWKRYKFKGSMEWMMVWVVQRLSGKRSARFRE